MIIMFITFILLAVLAFKLGVYSMLFTVLKLAAGILFFLAGGFILYMFWKHKSHDVRRIAASRWG